MTAEFADAARGAPETAMEQMLEQLLAQMARDVIERRRLPEATYRLQFHAGFTFRDAEHVVPYLRELGISHCYASPYLKARPGSRHGYDISDHRHLNPEIGTEEDYDAFVEALHAHGLGQILDTVPNHMGIVGNENQWWNDILENGSASAYAGFFDIGWQSAPRAELQNKILLPILGEPYGKALETGAFRLHYGDGVFSLHYYDHRFPIAPCTYELILTTNLEVLETELGKEAAAFLEYQSILTAVRHLPAPTETDSARIAERQREKEVIKRRLAALTQENAAVRAFVERSVVQFNGQPSDRHSFDRLDELLNRQPYRLSYWRVASDEINYRRFFDVNELAALSIERGEVFAATHELLFRLLRDRQIDGLRIDHPDGLYDPKQYLQCLQEEYLVTCARAIYDADEKLHALKWPVVEDAVRDVARGEQSGSTAPLYVVVEKILGANESLRRDWPSYGTSGYDFLNMVNRLFVDTAAAPALTKLYHDWIQDDTPFAELVYRSKFLVLQTAMASELHMLAHQLDRLAQKNRASRDFTLHSLRHALRAVIACFPVYRSYIAGEDIAETDRKYILRAVNRARMRNPALSADHFHFIRDMLLLRYPESFSEEDRAEQRRFGGKFQQVTAPVMAKGLEDTTFYVYNRLLSLNEVGGDADWFGMSPALLHQYFQERQEHWPWALSALSTHDTKRSEDIRARLNVLTEMPTDWRDALARWSVLNQALRVDVEEVPVPDPNEEYFLYQTLLGAWPVEPCDPETYRQFVQRIQAYMQKAVHEAKVHTSWVNPHPEYDQAIQTFVARILDPIRNAAFLEDFRLFQQCLSHFGMFNSLAQTVLKLTAPGAADTYQGTELWDFSLVDPDNRRPVDFEGRRRMLADLDGREQCSKALAVELLAKKDDGRIKLFVMSRALRARRDHPGLFTMGAYVPLEVEGRLRQHVFAFLRHYGDESALVAVPRLLTNVVGDSKRAPVGVAVWGDTNLVIPKSALSPHWRNLFTNAELSCDMASGRAILSIARLFATFPVALLVAER